MAKLLQEVLAPINYQVLQGNVSGEIMGLAIDSRKVSTGFLFFAIKGSHSDGHDFVQAAIENGAAGIVCTEDPKSLPKHLHCIIVEDSREAVAQAAAVFYDYPSRHLKLIGVTGTNGKSSVVSLLHQLHSGLGYKCGLLSTIKNQIDQEERPSSLTTPDPISLNLLLRNMVDANCSHAFMEVSSHAIDQKRVFGVHFELAIFTNLSHDHLDYHHTFAEYLATKKKLFDSMPASSIVLVNVDDPRGNVMLQNCAAQQYTYALRTMADFKGRILENGPTGLHMYFDEQDLHVRLLGVFNAYNLMAVYAATRLLGTTAEQALPRLSALTPPAGRFEAIHDSVGNRTFVVDYAHTPDALKNVLQTIQKIKDKGGWVVTVVGCGGDRDVTKRPIMAKIAVTYSDRVILTSDNPRSEPPESIIEDMMKGLDATESRKVLRIADRGEAIRTAHALAAAGSMILIAGKGHEAYQEINGVRNPFSDQEFIENLLHPES